MKKRPPTPTPDSEEDRTGDDLAENLYGDGPTEERRGSGRRRSDESPTPILEEILIELRALREETHRTRLAVEGLGARIDRLGGAARPGKRPA